MNQASALEIAIKKLREIDLLVHKNIIQWADEDLKMIIPVLYDTILTLKRSEKINVERRILELIQILEEIQRKYQQMSNGGKLERLFMSRTLGKSIRALKNLEQSLFKISISIKSSF
jgi:hypothetical protein